MEEHGQVYLKKAICNMNCNWMIHLGVFRSAPFFFRQQFGILIARTISSDLVKVLGNFESLSCFEFVLSFRIFSDTKTYDIIESGLSNNLLKEVSATTLGVRGSAENTRDYRACIQKNDISTLNDDYKPIKFANVQLFLLSISSFCVILLVLSLIGSLVGAIISKFQNKSTFVDPLETTN